MPRETQKVVTLSKKNHSRFLSVYLQYPHVLRVFENIQAGRNLCAGLEKFMHNKDVLLITLEHLYLPILESSELIAKNPKSPNGWRALASEVRFESDCFSPQDKAKVVAAVAQEIANSVHHSTNPENVFSVNISGTHSPENVQKFFKSVRQAAIEILNTPSENEINCVEFRLIMLGLFGGEKNETK
jgi:hypothetical protein